MVNLSSWFIRLGDKSGTLGAIVAAMGCSFCFPAIASLGAAIGLGFLAQWEGFLLTRVLPVAAALTLIVNIAAYYHHRQWFRSLLGCLGPLAILLILEFWFIEYWRSEAIYAALGLMASLSILDLIAPANRRCTTGSNTQPEHPV